MGALPALPALLAPLSSHQCICPSTPPWHRYWALLKAGAPPVLRRTGPRASAMRKRPILRCRMKGVRMIQQTTRLCQVDYLLKKVCLILTSLSVYVLWMKEIVKVLTVCVSRYGGRNGSTSRGVQLHTTDVSSLAYWFLLFVLGKVGQSSAAIPTLLHHFAFTTLFPPFHLMILTLDIQYRPHHWHRHLLYPVFYSWISRVSRGITHAMGSWLRPIFLRSFHLARVRYNVPPLWR